MLFRSFVGAAVGIKILLKKVIHSYQEQIQRSQDDLHVLQEQNKKFKKEAQEAGFSDKEADMLFDMMKEVADQNMLVSDVFESPLMKPLKDSIFDPITYTSKTVSKHPKKLYQLQSDIQLLSDFENKPFESSGRYTLTESQKDQWFSFKDKKLFAKHQQAFRKDALLSEDDI